MCMDLLKIREQIQVLNLHADFYHIDIMDGHFVKNITLSPDFVKAVARVSRVPLDCHLMVTHPDDYITMLAQAGATFLSPHAETINTDCFRTLNRIRAAGCQVGVTLNPATPLSYCQHYLNRIDVLTLMTVDVGYAGQPFIEELLEKIAQAARLREENGWHYKSMIDGSCNQKTFRRLYEAGADVFVMGSSGLFSLDADLKAACDTMKRLFAQETGVKL